MKLHPSVFLLVEIPQDLVLTQGQSQIPVYTLPWRGAFVPIASIRKLHTLNKTAFVECIQITPKVGPWYQEWFDNRQFFSVCLLQYGSNARFCPQSSRL